MYKRQAVRPAAAPISVKVGAVWARAEEDQAIHAQRLQQSLVMGEERIMDSLSGG